MSLAEALIIAIAVTAVYVYFVGEKIIKVDFSCLRPRNLKSAKLKRLLHNRNTPLQGAGLHGDIRNAFENILIPLAKTDKDLLPARMDMVFRRNIEQQLSLLKLNRLYRDIRLADVVPIPKNDFKRWNDEGREWREAVLQCSELERLVSMHDGKPVYELYRKNAYARILQSRHIRNFDRTEKKKNYYADKAKIICPSCGAQVKLGSQRAVCPYCGGVIQSDFYDWQTEAFEIYERIGTNLRRALQLSASSTILFVCLFLCLWLIRDTEISLAAGMGAALLVSAVIIALIIIRRIRQEKLIGEIVRYSENHLRSCISEALFEEVNRIDLMDYSVGTIILKKIVNSDDTTRITAKVYVSETYLPENRKPYTKRFKRIITLQRARYPEKRKADGEFFVEMDCPSCGANFMPDENNCCSFCGFGLRVNNAKWVIQNNK